MTPLPLDSFSGPEDLRTYLESVLPESRVTEALIDKANKPMQFLQTAHVVAAFAFSNGDVGKSYKTQYNNFKKYYAEQNGKWDSLDIAFVFCVRPDVPDLEGFCSKVETDVYFCRKFVVPLSGPLEEVLARLPFLPLTPVHGQSLRPPSAQTFLQRCGVPAGLARFLVIQGERSPGRIVEDCISGVFGPPQELTPIPNTSLAKVERSANPIQLDAVVIKNFRAYRKPQPFAIGADVTVLYGPNGFGKTSFFDAIDFAFTGDIARIKVAESHFEKTARHLDSKSEESFVSLSLKCKDSPRELRRTVSGRKLAALNGRSTERKAVLAQLTGGDIPGTDRVENFVSLFRATHLFSQEHQELAKEFENDCQLPGQIVSRMLALDDYANAINKAIKVREEFQNIITIADNEIRKLMKELDDDRNELNRLGQTANAYVDEGALDVELKSMRQALREIGISVPVEEVNVVIVRNWRASLEARYSESQSRANRLSVLSQKAADLPRVLTEINDLQQQLVKKEHSLSSTDEKRSLAEQELQVAEQRVTEYSTKRAELRTRATQLEWIRKTKPNYDKILDGQKKVTDELNRALVALQENQLSKDMATTNLRSAENLAGQANEKLPLKRAEATALQILKETASAWQANHARLASVSETEQASLRSLESLNEEERGILPQLATLRAEESRLSRQIAEVDQSHTDLKKLVSQLQSHVHDGICPLCGDDHKSKDELLRRIQAHVVADAASANRSLLTDIQEKISQVVERLAGNEQKCGDLRALVASSKNERAKLTGDIETFARSAAILGIVVTASTPNLVEQVGARYDRVQQEITELNGEIRIIGDSLRKANTAFTNAGEVVFATTTEIANRKATFARLQEEANQLRQDTPQIEATLDDEPTRLAEIEQHHNQDLVEINAQTMKVEEVVAKKRSEVNALRQESTTQKSQIVALRGQLTNLQRTATQTSGELAETKTTAEDGKKSLSSLIAEESLAQAQLLKLRDTAASIELAIDAATTSAALTQFRQNLRNKEKALEVSKQRGDRHRPWLKYFEGLSRVMSFQQSEAVATFTRNYGPRTSVIQRRLRAVYGFDEIEIGTRESTISVRVKRHGEDLRPTDYFSQSQLQTLLLSLFLTAGLSQTWSSLSPIFLDDPVTHFDDLNTYAFLDLIVGLLESDFEHRQFVMSTCDEKFLQLARQKFRHLGARAKFYIFSAISADGPVVEEIEQS